MYTTRAIERHGRKKETRRKELLTLGDLIKWRISLKHLLAGVLSQLNLLNESATGERILMYA
jgi:hypothetical protein